MLIIISSWLGGVFVGFYYNRLDNNMLGVLDTKDLVYEGISTSVYKRLKGRGVNIQPISEIGQQIGVSQNGFSYQLLLRSTNTLLYEGRFPCKNNRNDLYCPEISLDCIRVAKNTLLVAVICNCWCKYDIETPMVMVNIVALPLKSLANGYLSVFMSNPVHLVNKNSLKYLRDYELEDFPDDCCVDSSAHDRIRFDNGLRILGVDYGFNIPVHEDLCKRLVYLKI